MAKKEVLFQVSVTLDDSGEFDEDQMAERIQESIDRMRTEGRLTELSDETTLVEAVLVTHMVTCDMTTAPNHIVNIPGEILIAGNMAVCLANIGEGKSGDYDPSDANDVALLRLDVMVRGDGGRFEQLDNGSCCTQIPVATPPAARQNLLEMMAVHLAVPLQYGESVKRVVEELSYVGEDWDGILPLSHTPLPSAFSQLLRTKGDVQLSDDARKALWNRIEGTTA